VDGNALHIVVCFPAVTRLTCCLGCYDQLQAALPRLQHLRSLVLECNFSTNIDGLLPPSLRQLTLDDDLPFTKQTFPPGSATLC
jgi:hypothetical protein